jgi:ferredoxin
MADKNDKIPENVPGKYYVDKTCTPCHTCMEVEGVAPLLMYNEDKTYVYFHKQPATEEEIKIAEDALAICPPFDRESRGSGLDFPESVEQLVIGWAGSS